MNYNYQSEIAKPVNIRKNSIWGSKFQMGNCKFRFYTNTEIPSVWRQIFVFAMGPFSFFPDRSLVVALSK